MSNLKIRDAVARDAESLRAIIAAAYAPYLEQGLELPPVTDGLEEDISAGRVFVAEIDGNLAGGAVYLVGTASVKLVNLAVSPGFSGQGVGQALLSAVADTARASDLSALTLVTHVQMIATQAFYLRRGWSETGRDGNRVYMARDLS